MYDLAGKIKANLYAVRCNEKVASFTLRNQRAHMLRLKADWLSVKRLDVFL